jgi:hypothetical protein
MNVPSKSRLETERLRNRDRFVCLMCVTDEITYRIGQPCHLLTFVPNLIRGKSLRWVKGNKSCIPFDQDCFIMRIASVDYVEEGNKPALT